MGYPEDPEAIIEQMGRLADASTPRQDQAPPLLPDFDSFRQALNVASADQRVLVVLQGSGSHLETAREKLRKIAWSSEIVGRFHYDASPEKNWNDNIPGLGENDGIHLIIPGEFGIDGQLHSSLALTATPETIRSAMTAANRNHAATTEQKNYASHVARGRELGIYFAGNVPYGEDRDGDGVIDAQQPRKGTQSSPP